MSSSDSVFQLECGVNNYQWGKKGSKSLAARYAASAPGGSFKLEEHEDYAEMWLGTYPTTPSKVLSSGEDLQRMLDANKEKLIGKPILAKFGSNLPFLPKILSISKALPLQIHPDKELAAKLHAKNPEKFSDTNHKPEIAIALSTFEVFVGWSSLDKIQKLFNSIDALKSHFLDPSLGESDFTHETLRSIVFKILSASDSEIRTVYQALRETPFATYNHTFRHIGQLLPRLAKQNDVTDPGNLVALLTMNYLILQKGEAIFVPADGIHAYLSGDIVECMARSDNVINTGFCPRADRDSAELFTAALTFSPRSVDETILKAQKSDKGRQGYTMVLAPPMAEFNMLVTELEEPGQKEIIQALGGPSVLVITGGSGKLRAKGKSWDVKEGYVFFIGFDTEVELEANGELEAHIAFCEA